MRRAPPAPRVDAYVTTKVGAAGAASPTRVMVVAGRTIWSSALIVFRDELENAGIWTFVNGPDSLSTTRRCATSGTRACSARRRASAWARPRDRCSSLLRGGCFAHTLAGGVLRLGVLGAAIGAGALRVLLRSSSTRRAATVLRCGWRPMYVFQ
jgi:hypothetical protein